jgi:hypothetical protein
MFYALDKNTNEVIRSTNVRSINYKNTYKRGLTYICCYCGNKDIEFVNAKKITPYFRHSALSKCPNQENIIEFNKTFYEKWHKLFKHQYIKPYWFNNNLADIKDENMDIMIRYSEQKSEFIKTREKYSQKVLWILSVENRLNGNYVDNIKHYCGKIYISFRGTKNDVGCYDESKSEVYLDTDTDILIKVNLNATDSIYGHEIELIDIKKFCEEYEYLFIANPYRKKDVFFRKIIEEQKQYIEEQEKNKLRAIEYNKRKKTQAIILKSLRLKQEIAQSIEKCYNEEVNQILKYDDSYIDYETYQQYLHNKICEENIQNIMNKIRSEQMNNINRKSK